MPSMSSSGDQADSPGLIYAVMYSFFKSFPLVYGEGGYGWGLGVQSLPFLGLVVGEGIGVGGYALWNW